MGNKFPPGWDKNRVQKLIAHYENQTEDETIAEDEAAYEDQKNSFIEVPNKLIPKVRELLIKG